MIDARVKSNQGYDVWAPTHPYNPSGPSVKHIPWQLPGNTETGFCLPKIPSKFHWEKESLMSSCFALGQSPAIPRRRSSSFWVLVRTQHHAKPVSPWKPRTGKCSTTELACTLGLGRASIALVVWKFCEYVCSLLSL